MQAVLYTSIKLIVVKTKPKFYMSIALFLFFLILIFLTSIIETQTEQGASHEISVSFPL